MALGEPLAQQVRALCEQLAEVELLRLALAVTRELEQAVDDAGGAESLPLDLSQQLVARIVLRRVGEQHLGIARDAGDRRVDLVRHARGEHAEGGQPVLLAQRRFHGHALGDVLHHENALAAALDLPVEPSHRKLIVLLDALGVAERDLDQAGAHLGQRHHRQELGERPPEDFGPAA